MKTTAKPLALALLCALLPLSHTLPATAAAQPDEGRRPHACAPATGGKERPHFHPKAFVKELTASITRKAGLTEAEAKAFFPLFFEMKGKQRDIQRRIERSLAQGAERSMEEKDYRRLLKGVEELERKKNRVTAEYIERLSRLVGAEKTVRALSADLSFGRGQFRKMAGKGK